MPNKHKRKEQVGLSTVENDIFVGAVRYTDKMLAEINQLLSIWGMTVLQYNALRILYVYDEKNTGLPSGDIGKYLYTRVPDVTRLLDRLADKGWLIRERDSNNRRVVRARLTKIGIELVESIYLPLNELEEKNLAHMNNTDKLELKRLLDLALNQAKK